jgi:hypothetical protein
MKIDYQKFLAHLCDTGMKKFAGEIAPVVENYFANLKNADFAKWINAANALPDMKDISIDLSADTVRIGDGSNIDTAQRAEIIERLMQLHPWRKGPFELFGTKIDTEWRSDWMTSTGTSELSVWTMSRHLFTIAGELSTAIMRQLSLSIPRRIASVEAPSEQPRS